jgi:hypothetical protein
MAIGPVQLLVVGVSQPKFHGEIIAELERLRESDLVRVIDSLAVYKDADGELEVEHEDIIATALVAADCEQALDTLMTARTGTPAVTATTTWRSF